MHCLNIFLPSFRLSNEIINQNDKVRVSITTIPEKNKQAFIIDAKDMNNSNLQFSVDITDKTKGILFVFRRKNFMLNDPIVCSTVANSSDFPRLTDEHQTTEFKYINLYERSQDTNKISSDPRIIGEMKIQYTILELPALQDKKATGESLFPFLNFFFNNNEKKNQKENKMLSSIMIFDEN